MRNKILITLVLIHSLIFIAVAQQISQVQSKDVAELIKKDKKIIVLDVRTMQEYQSGFIKGAKHIDISQPDATGKIKGLNRDNEYIVYCRTKNRSGVVTKFMVENGFKHIYQMTDGIVGWTSNNLPLEK